MTTTTYQLDVPFIGEQYLGENPAPEKCYKVLVGVESTNDIIVAAQDTYTMLNLPAGAIVTKVLARVITAFTTSVTLTVGDGVNADGFFASADLAPQTAVSTGVLLNSLEKGQAYDYGKEYLAADTIDITLAGATAAAGQLELMFFIILPEN